jgi:hypothetical protein
VLEREEEPDDEDGDDSDGRRNPCKSGKAECKKERKERKTRTESPTPRGVCGKNTTEEGTDGGSESDGDTEETVEWEGVSLRRKKKKKAKRRRRKEGKQADP